MHCLFIYIHRTLVWFAIHGALSMILLLLIVACALLFRKLAETSENYIQLTCLPCSVWMRETMFVRSVMIVLLHGKQWSSHFAVSIAAFSLLLSVATQGSHREKGLSQIAVHHTLFLHSMSAIPAQLQCVIERNVCPKWMAKEEKKCDTLNQNVHAMSMEIRKKKLPQF